MTKNFLIILFFLLFCNKIKISKEILRLEDNFFPEGIAVSKFTGDIFVGSLKENKIVKFPNGKNEPVEFVSSAKHGLLSVIGIIVDDKQKILWACSSNPGVSNYPSDNPIISLKAFDLVSGNLINTYPFFGGGFCNDITIDSNGNVYATDSFNPRILRVNKSQNRLETWFEDDVFQGKGFNLNGITYVDNSIYTVKMNSGELFKIDIEENGKPSNFTKIDLPRSLNAPDGIEAIDKNNLLVAENRAEGTWTGSLTKINLTSPLKMEVLKDNLDTPTTVALKGKRAWVLQAQFSHLFGDEKDLPPEPFEIISVPYKTSFLTSLKKLLDFMN
jgi:sugar lactone lactonase YvrE